MTGPLDLPLWFLRDLIVITLLTPFVYWLVKRFGRWTLLVLGLCYASKVWFLMPGFSIDSVFFFAWGAYYSVHQKNFVQLFSFKKELTYVLTILLLLVLAICTWKHILWPVRYFDGLYICAALMASVSLGAALLSAGKVKVVPLLAQCSFFVYALHTLEVLDGVKRLSAMILPGHELWALTLDYFFVPTFTVAVVSLFIG